MSRTLIPTMLLVLGGCQCLQPVMEGATDSGPDAGLDGGLGGGKPDGGPVGACNTAAQCVGALPSQSLCNFSSDAGYSCIDQRCVFECSRDRTCTFDAGTSCLDCSASTSCIDTGCGAAVRQGDVEGSTCTVGFTTVMMTSSGGCLWQVTDATGTKGVLTRVGGVGVYVGRFAGLGTCVGVSLFTQVERVLFSCEGCQFVLRI